MGKVFSLKPRVSEIEGKPAEKWLRENNEIIVIPRNDGVAVKNVCCTDIKVNGKNGRDKFVPMSTAVLLQPNENSIIKICGHLFTLIL